MPARGKSSAPAFDRTKPRELTRYFSDLELCFANNPQIKEPEKKEKATYYVDFDTEQMWKAMPTYADALSSYADFKKAILATYPDGTGDNIYSMREMDSLIGERQRLGIYNANELAEFHRRFQTITAWLILKQQLSDLEQRRAYLRAYSPALLASVKSRLQIKYPDQHPNIPHKIDEVYEAAQYVLQSSPESVSMHAVGTMPPVTILQRPVPAVASPEPAVKVESIATLFSELTKTLIDVINSKNAYQRPPRDASTRQTNCNFCDGQHYIRECQIVEEYIRQGKCRRNQDGKVVLPSGIFVPREIPGTLLAERIDEWHKRFPNQLAAASLLHTVAREVLAAPAIKDAVRSYTLTEDERIASLRAEEYNLRARRQPPPQTSIIQTRAQQARNQQVPPAIDNRRPASNIRPENPEPAREPALPVAQPPVAQPPVAQPPIRIYPRPTVEEEVQETQPEPEHPYRNARDAAYTPPAAKNVGAIPKAPAYKKPEAAYRTLPPVHDPEISGTVFNRMMDTQIPISGREVLSLSPEVRAHMREATTTRRVANPVNNAPTSFIVEVGEDDVPVAAYAYEEVDPPNESNTIADPIEAYYKTLGPEDSPDLERLRVASEQSAIRSVCGLVSNRRQVECILDPGCQIVAMSEKECNLLSLAYDPDIKLYMESANGQHTWSCGLSRNVPIKIADITFYFQIHIVPTPAYTILLGRPFDVLARSIVQNFANEDQTITIHDPNSSKRVTVHTFPRGTLEIDPKSREDFH